MSLELTGEKLIIHNNSGVEKFNSDQDLIHQIGYATWSGQWSYLNYTLNWDHGLNINTAGDIVVPYITITSGTDNIGSIASQFIGIRQPAQGLVPMNFDARNVDNLPTLDSAYISIYVGKDKVFLTNHSLPYNLQGGGNGTGATSQRGSIAYNAKKAPQAGIGTVYYTFEMFVYRYVTPVSYKNNSNPFIVNGGVPKIHDLVDTVMGWELSQDDDSGNPESPMWTADSLSKSQGLLRGYAHMYKQMYNGSISSSDPESTGNLNDMAVFESNSYLSANSTKDTSWVTFTKTGNFEVSDDYDGDNYIPGQWYRGSLQPFSSTTPPPEIYFEVASLPSDVNVYNADYATPGTGNYFRIYRDDVLIREFTGNETIDFTVAMASGDIKFEYYTTQGNQDELTGRDVTTLHVLVNTIYERDHNMFWLKMTAEPNV
jgi:hypothetical protein